jgi:hypothetical protein
MRHTRRTALALISAAITLPWAQAAAQDRVPELNQKDIRAPMTVDHSLWANILTAYLKVSPDGVNRFAYGKVSKADRKKLKAYLEVLGATPVSALAEAEQRAFWANLYNALTIEVILDHYPVKSIREISISPGLFSVGPWGKKLIEVEGRSLSLDDIEHKTLRKIWKDPRVHYSVNCASYGCPNLPAEPFTGAKLEKMLDEGARAFVNHPRGVSVDDNGRVKVSRIYDWYAEDFGGTNESILKHLRQYASAALRKKLSDATKISAYDYDWSLNDAP